MAGSSPSLPDGSNPSAAIVQSASDVQCSRLLKTTGGAPVYFAHMQKSYPSLAKLVNIDSDPVYSNVRGFHLVGELITGQVGTNRTSMV